MGEAGGLEMGSDEAAQRPAPARHERHPRRRDGITIRRYFRRRPLSGSGMRRRREIGGFSPRSHLIPLSRRAPRERNLSRSADPLLGGKPLRTLTDRRLLRSGPECGRVVHMLEVTVARLRSRLASILEAARAGEEIVIRRHGTRVAVLKGIDARGSAARRSLGEPSKLPTRLDTGPVEPVRIRGRLLRSPAQDLVEERD